MTAERAVVLGDGGAALPEAVFAWLAARGLPTVSAADADLVMAIALRTLPALAVLDARSGAAAEAQAHAACRRLKADSYTAIVPVVLIAANEQPSAERAFAAGADEVLRADVAPWEATARLDALVRRAARDTGVHPTTRLAGTSEIEADIQRRIDADASFSACYADLDHFKEYNDRYGYNEGDRVIRLVARVLHDVVKGRCGERGFVGHIGGDDFMFVVPREDTVLVCDEIIEIFDLLVPFQYSEADRRAGYYFGKDRRGLLHKVPLMTLSIGVVTNERRRFARAAQVSELATEMKTYAKSLTGSVYAVDRRQDAAAAPDEAPAPARAEEEVR
jgi:GGDEF domain-containing protein